MDNKKELLAHLSDIHTTPMGQERICRNLAIDIDDVTSLCQEMIQNNQTQVMRKGKNWYVTLQDITWTINAHSFTIITAHRKGSRP